MVITGAACMCVCVYVFVYARMHASVTESVVQRKAYDMNSSQTAF